MTWELRRVALAAVVASSLLACFSDRPEKRLTAQPEARFLGSAGSCETGYGLVGEKPDSGTVCRHLVADTEFRYVRDHRGALVGIIQRWDPPDSSADVAYRRRLQSLKARFGAGRELCSDGLKQFHDWRADGFFAAITLTTAVEVGFYRDSLRYVTPCAAGS